MNFLRILNIIYFFTLFIVNINCKVDVHLSKVWGPGLKPDKIVMPARYFFIEARDKNNNSVLPSKSQSSSSSVFAINITGLTENNRPCRVWTNYLDRKDGSYIIRYKVYDKCDNFQISITYNSKHVDQSPYIIKDYVYADDCDCPIMKLSEMMSEWNCGKIPFTLEADLKPFTTINWNNIRKKLISQFDKPYSVSFCHYVMKNNKVYRACYGKYVGFKMFMDNILLSLSRKAVLPDIEFFVNLGDWPLVTNDLNVTYPMFSWCGSTDTSDIVMPTYDISESTLENMGRVTLDMLSVQGNVKSGWNDRRSKAFWRGRDSSRERLKLISLAKEHPDLINASLTNFFFFKDEEEKYGPKVEHTSFFNFFDYKFQLGLDGTVSAYRFPYLLGGGSLVFKQDSKYYEHFYRNLISNTHYVPIRSNIEDLVEKLKWAIKNDDSAKRIAENGRTFANDHLLPKNIFCYYAHLLQEFSQRIVSKINIQTEMELVPQKAKDCNCFKIKDEL